MDPQANDVGTYIQFAKAKGMEIKYVVDTHVQADHVSGGRTLAQLTGADYCLHESADMKNPEKFYRTGLEILKSAFNQFQASQINQYLPNRQPSKVLPGRSTYIIDLRQTCWNQILDQEPHSALLAAAYSSH